MKRLLIVAAVLGAATVMASAAGAQSPGTVNPPTTVGPSFVDANGDGVCDNCTGTPRGQGQKVRKGKGGSGSGERYWPAGHGPPGRLRLRSGQRQLQRDRPEGPGPPPLAGPADHGSHRLDRRAIGAEGELEGGHRRRRVRAGA